MNANKIKVVVIGGGNGSGFVLSALKPRADELDVSAVISMSDSNGSSGALRRHFNVPPPGDIMRAVIAMSRHDSILLKKIFYRNRISCLTNFDKKIGATKGSNIGNLFLALVSEQEGDFVKAVRALEEGVEAFGRAYPVTLDLTEMCVELTNGDIVKTDEKIDVPTYDRSLKIKRMWLEPAGKIYKPVKQILEEADYIIFSIGSLYTSVVATLLPVGVKEALAVSKAQLVYISGNAYQAEGETGPERLSDFVFQLENYLPRPVDLIIYNDCKLNAAQCRLYKEKNWLSFAMDVGNLKERNLIGADFERTEGGLSATKLSRILEKILFNRDTGRASKDVARHDFVKSYGNKKRD